MMGGCFHWKLPFGAELVGPSHTHFRLWAPSVDAVMLEVEGEAFPMDPRSAGWFEAEVACGAGARYRFIIGGQAVPDPASRAQHGDMDGPSLVVDPSVYVWHNPSWNGRPWHEAIIYELHVGVCGGYRGVAARLPELTDLGVTAIELMPVAEFPGARNWGYDGVLPFAPEASYGSPDELKALVDRAHDLGLMIFLDVVYNHFGPAGNWLGTYATPFFRTDLTTPWGPAIDFRRREVRDFFIANALYWLMEYRFDGLRLDAVHAIPDQDWIAELAARVHATVEPGRQVHLVIEHEDNAASLLGSGIAAQWNDDGHHALHVLLTGETDSYYRDYSEGPAQHLARCLAEGFAYQGEPSPHRGGRPRGQPSTHLPPTSFVLFLQNHDQIGNRAFGERLTRLADPDSLRAATALLLLAPQIPLLFMGEEWGVQAPFLYFTSHAEALARAVRNGRRREFAAFPAFADEARRAAIPDPNEPSTFTCSNPFARPGDETAFAYVRALLGIRHTHIVPRLPGSRAIDAKAAGAAAVLARWRMGDGAMLTIAANLGKTSVLMFDIPEGEMLFESVTGATDLLTYGYHLPAATTIAWVGA